MTGGSALGFLADGARTILSPPSAEGHARPEMQKVTDE